MNDSLDPDLFANCAASKAPVRIGDKWTAKILTCLLFGSRRFSELEVPLRGITPKVLTESLRAMERDGYITRTAHPETPPRVEYTVTPLGRTLLQAMVPVCEWTDAHLAEILHAREEYEHHQPSRALNLRAF